MDNAGKKLSRDKQEDEGFLPRSDHTNHELHRIREENLEGARAGQAKGGLFYSNYYSQHSQAHFNANEVQFILNKRPELKENNNCRRLYLELRKNFGIKQKYSELIMLCKNCRYLHIQQQQSFRICIYPLFRCVFWSSYGHPCLASADTYDAPVPLSPATFLSFFNV